MSSTKFFVLSAFFLVAASAQAEITCYSQNESSRVSKELCLSEITLSTGTAGLIAHLEVNGVAGNFPVESDPLMRHENFITLEVSPYDHTVTADLSLSGTDSATIKFLTATIVSESEYGHPSSGRSEDRFQYTRVNR